MRYLLDSLQRAVAVVELLQANPVEAMPLSRLAREAGVNKTTVLRILRTLEHCGWVVQAAPGQYRLTFQRVDTKPRRVGYASRDDRLSFPLAVSESIAQTASGQGVELLRLDNRGSRTQTLKNVERMIREKVEVAIVFQPDAALGPEIASLFHESGTPVISLEMPIAGAAYFGADSYSAGITAGRAAARLLLKSGIRAEEMLILGAPGFGSPSGARLNAFRKAFQEQDKRNASMMVTQVEGNGSFASGLRLTRLRMKSSRKRRCLVVCQNDPTALGAAQAVEESGRAGDWMVWSFGGALDVRMELRRKGSPMIGAIGLAPERYGDQVWNLVSAMLEKRPAPPALFARMRVLTRENIGEMYPHDLELNAARS